MPSRSIRVLFLMARTGGGHLSASQAIAEALYHHYGDAVHTHLVDALADYAPFPFSRLEDAYPIWIGRLLWTWRWGYRLTDGPRRATAILRLFWPLVWPAARRLLREHPADLIVSAHPLTNHPVLWAIRRLGRAIPLVTVVTDPVSVHPFWLAPGVDRCLVGSQPARHKALACGLPAAIVRVTGLPVSRRFVAGLTDPVTARRRLGWPADERPVVLLVGGGEGMGQLEKIARAIDQAQPDARLAIVAGRNEPLRRRLATTAWHIPTQVYGFVQHMPWLMSAADLLVTKAGPSTLSEAFIAGLPLILSGAIPGQEEGNVRLVVQSGAGVWAPDPARIASLVGRWTEATASVLAPMAARSRSLARPQAADEAAREIGQLLPDQTGANFPTET